MVDPIDQTTDLLNAIHWVAGDPQCDAGAHRPLGLELFGRPRRLCRGPRPARQGHRQPGAGARLAVGGRQPRLEAHRPTAKPPGAPAARSGYPEPGARVIQGLRGAPIRERMINYAPVDDVEKAPSCAMLFILAEKEEYFNNKDHGIKAFERAKGPKKLVTIPGITHYGIYGPARPQAQKLAIEWFDEHLKGRADRRPPKRSDSAKDWSMYNHDVIGTRHNPAETALSAENAAPARGEMAVPGPRDRTCRSAPSTRRRSSSADMSISARPRTRRSTS